MSLKSISPTFPPHVGSGFFSHTPSEWSRYARIHSGSDFIWEIISTISRSSPFRDLNAYASSGSWNPNLYWSRSILSGLVTTMMRNPSSLVPDPEHLAGAPDLALVGDLGGHLLVLGPDAVVPDLVELLREHGVPGGHDPAVEHHVDGRRLDVFQDPRVVGDEEHPHLPPRGLVHPVDAGRHYLDGVDVQPGVGLIHDGDLRLEDGHLEDLAPLLLPAAESLVHVPPQDLRVDLQLLDL